LRPPIIGVCPVNSESATKLGLVRATEHPLNARLSTHWQALGDLAIDREFAWKCHGRGL